MGDGVLDDVQLQAFYKKSAQTMASCITDVLGTWYGVDQHRLTTIEKPTLLEYIAPSWMSTPILPLDELELKLTQIRAAAPRQFQLISLLFLLDETPPVMHLICLHRRLMPTDLPATRRTRPREEIEDADEKGVTDGKSPQTKRRKLSPTGASSPEKSGPRQHIEELFSKLDAKEWSDTERKFYRPLAWRAATLQGGMTPETVRVQLGKQPPASSSPRNATHFIKATGYSTLSYRELLNYRAYGQANGCDLVWLDLHVAERGFVAYFQKR